MLPDSIHKVNKISSTLRQKESLFRNEGRISGIKRELDTLFLFPIITFIFKLKTYFMLLWFCPSKIHVPNPFVLHLNGFWIWFDI